MEIEWHIFENQHAKEEIKKKIKKFLDSNENENTMYQNLWNTAKSKWTEWIILKKISINAQ
jgi:hypothetical protein